MIMWIEKIRGLWFTILFVQVCYFICSCNCIDILIFYSTFRPFHLEGKVSKKHPNRLAKLCFLFPHLTLHSDSLQWDSYHLLYKSYFWCVPKITKLLRGCINLNYVIFFWTFKVYGHSIKILKNMLKSCYIQLGF